MTTGFLPSNWVLATLEDLVMNPSSDIVDGPFGSNLKASEYKDKGVPIIRLQNIDRNQFIDKNIKFISDQKAEELQRHNFVADDIVITKLGDPVGKAAIVPDKYERGIIVADLVRTRIEPVYADKRYITYAINSPSIIKSLQSEVKGTTRPRVNLSQIRQLAIPLAPLNEQKRIADKLDLLLARVNKCQSHLDRIPKILKRFRQSVLASAISGGLTSKGYANEKKELHLSEVIERIKTGPYGSTLHKSDYTSNGIPLVNPIHINDGRITPSPNVTVSKEKANELKEFFLTRGDVVLARRGVMGRCAVVGEKEEGWLCGSGSMLLHPTEQLLPEYLQIFLSSPETVAVLEVNSVGSTMSNLNQKILLRLTIPVPSLDEQTEIVQLVHSLFAYAERFEVRYQSVNEQVKMLIPSLLAKAFRGELLEQDPNDEPASVLLERIRAARNAQPVVSRHLIQSEEMRMYKMEETLEEIIQNLALDMFSFEDLQEKYFGDYEKLKDQFFTVLDSNNPIISQVFDESSQSMMFVRRK